MFAMILTMLLVSSPGGPGAAGDDARSLIETIEALQQPIEDFRCEFEGSTRYKGIVAATQGQKLGQDGLSQAFSGTFIWKRSGETYSDCLHRMEPVGDIARESLVVRTNPRQAEEYFRHNDAPLGFAVIKSPEEVNAWRPESFGWIFLIDKLKMLSADKGLEVTVSRDEIEGRSLKVFNVAIPGVADSIFMRFWVDLGRSGQVVRYETYAPGNLFQSRLEIKLAPFKVGQDEVWMPVSGDSAGYAGVKDDKPIITKAPTVLNSIYVVEGTMSFNRRPGAEVFTLKYKPGTPISDHLRKLNTEFGQQTIRAKPTVAEAETMLKEQLARADEQKGKLVDASQSEGFDWSSWAAWGLFAAVLASGTVFVVQRRGR